jgi:hypothetical protein
VSFVGGNNDARLVSDIEKLIKTKIELEAIEFDEDQPDVHTQGRINDGRRMYNAEGGDNGRSGGRGDGRGEGRGEGRPDRAPRAPRSDYARAPSAPRDPFFDKPYEPSIAEAVVPSWEATVKPSTRSISANIKPKRKVAALFKSE